MDAGVPGVPPKLLGTVHGEHHQCPVRARIVIYFAASSPFILGICSSEIFPPGISERLDLHTLQIARSFREGRSFHTSVGTFSQGLEPVENGRLGRVNKPPQLRGVFFQENCFVLGLPFWKANALIFALHCVSSLVLEYGGTEQKRHRETAKWICKDEAGIPKHQHPRPARRFYLSVTFHTYK